MPLNLNNQGIKSGQLFIYTHLDDCLDFGVHFSLIRR